MFNDQTLKVLVGQRLSAAAEEIFGLFEEAAVVYKTQICRLEKETERQRRLLNAVYNPQVVLEKEWVDLLTPDQPCASRSEESLHALNIKDEVQQVCIKQEVAAFPITIAEVVGLEQEPFLRRQNAENKGEMWAMERGATGPDRDDECAARASSSKGRMGIQRIDASDAGSKLKLHKCECGRVYASKEDLFRHMKEHIQDKPFRCSICGKSFTQKGAMKVHMRIHTGEKKFQCHFCEKRFTQVSTCNVHMKVHTRAVVGNTTAKPFQCPVCHKCFKIKPYLQAHILVHTEKPFSCPNCPKTFRRKLTLEAHMRAHVGANPCSCTECGVTFKRQSYLINHIHRVHSTEKPLKCTVCNRGFVHPNAFKTHMNSHTGERPFRCALCGKGFTQKGTLKRHMSPSFNLIISFLLL
uniref:C2H2-type domain-containing protein n=1 Tax=Neogobius melanostomus TaxID=47308 RepID=A0A8C6SEP8_9GOBI